MVHDFRGASTSVAAALLLLLFLLGSASCGSAEMTMNHLSRSELVHQAGYGEERLSSVLITGTILCDACLQHGSHLLSSLVKGSAYVSFFIRNILTLINKFMIILYPNYHIDIDLE